MKWIFWIQFAERERKAYVFALKYQLAFPHLNSSACVGQYMLKQQNIDDDWIQIWVVSQTRCSLTLCGSSVVEKASNFKWLYLRCGRGSFQKLFNSVLKCLQQETIKKWKLTGVCFGLIAGTWFPPSIPCSAIIGCFRSLGPEHQAAGSNLCRGLKTLVQPEKSMFL